MEVEGLDGWVHNMSVTRP